MSMGVLVASTDFIDLQSGLLLRASREPLGRARLTTTRRRGAQYCALPLPPHPPHAGGPASR